MAEELSLRKEEEEASELFNISLQKNFNDVFTCFALQRQKVFPSFVLYESKAGAAQKAT